MWIIIEQGTTSWIKYSLFDTFTWASAWDVDIEAKCNFVRLRSTFTFSIDYILRFRPIIYLQNCPVKTLTLEKWAVITFSMSHQNWNVGNSFIHSDRTCFGLSELETLNPDLPLWKKNRPSDGKTTGFRLSSTKSIVFTWGVWMVRRLFLSDMKTVDFQTA